MPAIRTSPCVPVVSTEAIVSGSPESLTSFQTSIAAAGASSVTTVESSTTVNELLVALAGSPEPAHKQSTSKEATRSIDCPKRRACIGNLPGLAARSAFGLYLRCRDCKQYC